MHACMHEAPHAHMHALHAAAVLVRCARAPSATAQLQPAGPARHQRSAAAAAAQHCAQAGPAGPACRRPFSKVTLAGGRPRLERFRRTQDRKTVPRVARMELPLNGRFGTDDDGTMMTTRNSRDQEAPSSSSSPQTLGSFLHASASMFHTHHVVTKNVFTDLSGWERLTCAQQLQQQRQHHVHCSKAP